MLKCCNKKILNLIIFLLYLSDEVRSASILALFSSLSFSDQTVFRAYTYLLAQRGHSVVVMSPYANHFQSPDEQMIIEMDVTKESEKYWEEYKSLTTNIDDFYTNMEKLNELYVKLAIAQLKSQPMTTLLMNPDVKFDLVITEADNPVLYGAADKYKVPHIAITASTGKLHQHKAKGNPTHPLLFPDYYSLNFNDLNIWQKLIEINRHIQVEREYNNHYLPLCQIAAEKIFGLKRDLRDVERDIDMLLIAGNPLLTGKRPNVLSVAYVDGLHIQPDVPLHPDLKSTLDSAEKGAVYFSLGALQEAEQLSPKLLQLFADTFKELPYKVFWKIGNTSMINQPDNVIAHPWFPQQELLAHPNVKAFITHGGHRSLEEALFYEVPIVGLPIIKNRKVFITEITKHGAGEILDPYYLNKDILKSTIVKVSSKEEYMMAMSALKQKFEDATISGPDFAVMCTEYVLRNGGAKHLRAPTVGYSLATYLMLDVLLTVIFVATALAFILYKLFKLLVRFVRIKIFRRTDVEGKFKVL